MLVQNAFRLDEQRPPERRREGLKRVFPTGRDKLDPVFHTRSTSQLANILGGIMDWEIPVVADLNSSKSEVFGVNSTCASGAIPNIPNMCQHGPTNVASCVTGVSAGTNCSSGSSN